MSLRPAVSPSLVYACAAALEGCSFVNGGSQNTVQPALLELAARGEGRSDYRTPLYMLGTDFKAGQTKAGAARVRVRVRVRVRADKGGGGRPS